MRKNFEDAVTKSQVNELSLSSVYLDSDNVLRHIDRIDKKTEIVLNMIAKSVLNINLDLFKKDNDLYNIALNILYNVLLEYKVSTNDFLNNIVDDLNKNTKLDWKVKNKEQKHKGYKTIGHHPLPLSVARYTDVSDVPITKTIYGKTKSIYLVSEKLGVEVLYAQSNNGEYTPIDAINEDIFEYANINGFINNNLPEILKTSYGENYLSYLRENKGKINNDFINLFDKYISVLSGKKDNLEQTNKELKETVDLIKKRQEEITITDEEFKKYDSSFYKEYFEYEKLPTASSVKNSVDFFNNLPSVDDSKLKLEEDKNGIRNGYNVCAGWTWCDDFDDIVENVFVKAPEEMLKILEMMTNLFNSINVKYKIIGKPKYYDHSNSNFNYKYFEKEQGIRISLLQGDKKLSIPYVKEKISKIQDLAKQLRSKNITSIDSGDVYDKLKFEDEEFVGAEESRKLFLENGWVAGECSNWLGDIIDGFLDSVEEYVGALSNVINKSEKNKIRVKTLNDRAEFYHKLYKKYGLKLNLDRKISKLNKKEEKNNQEIDRLNNRISDILNIFNSSDYKVRKNKSTTEIYYDQEKDDIKKTVKFLKAKVEQKKLVKKKEDQ